MTLPFTVCYAKYIRNLNTKHTANKASERAKRHLFVQSTLLLVIGFVVGSIAFYFLPSIQSTLIPNDYASTNVTTAAKITFAFDDGFVSSLSEAAPALAKYGFSGVVYVNSGCIDNIGVCRSRFSADRSFLSWDELRDLRDQYNWEIGNHTYSHIPLTTLTKAEQEQEIVGNFEVLKQHGFEAINFASPQGDYEPTTLAIIMRDHATHRGFHDIGANESSLFDNAILSAIQVQEGVSVEEVKQSIDEAIELEQWAILTFHDIKDTPSSNPQDYEYSTANLEAIAQHVKQRQDSGLVKVVTIKDAVTETRPNLIENHSFEQIGGYDWNVASPTLAYIDAENHGSYPSPRESAKLSGSAKDATLYTKSIPVEYGTKYELKVYVNAIDLKSGELSIVIDEHTSSDEWIRTEWMGEGEPGRVSHVTGIYEPSSAEIKTIRIQANLARNAKGTTYLDNFQLYKIE